MKYLGLSFFLFLALLPEVCCADSSCLWINKATAFGVLGTSEDSPMASVSEVSANACTFMYLSASGIREVRVTVEQAKDPEQIYNAYKTQCGSGGTPLRAIGNEAVICAADSKGRGEQIFGRVRDNVFTILISTSAGNDSSMSREALVQKAGLVAEQVSGNLF